MDECILFIIISLMFLYAYKFTMNNGVILFSKLATAIKGRKKPPMEAQKLILRPEYSRQIGVIG